MANKIKYGLRNVYYAPITTVSTAGVPTYGTPVRILGGVNLSMTPAGESTDFYADDVVFWHSDANNGYTGTLEVALIPESFKTTCLGETADTKSVVFEAANDTAGEFALMFEFQGDENATRHCLYRCTAARPDVTGATKEASITPQTETLNLTAMPRLDNQIVKSRCPYSSDAYANWFSAVYEKTTS